MKPYSRDFKLHPVWNKGKKTGPLPESTCFKMGLATKKKWADGVYDSRDLTKLRQTFKDPVRNQKISDGLKGNQSAKGKLRSHAGIYWRSIKRTKKQCRAQSKRMQLNWDTIWKDRRAKFPRYIHLTASKKYVAWRNRVFKRDNYTCQTVGCKSKRGCYIEAHHIKSWSKYVKLRYITKNGIILCKACHRKMHVKK
jgi:5-methylcytosine-specific restriction endonuclease McrA